MDCIKSREDIIPSVVGIGITALYIPLRNSAHVGLYWNWDQYSDVVHFRASNDIEIESISGDKFADYYFIPLSDFEEKFIDSLMAIAELIAENKNNNLILDLQSIVYAGSKFDISSGNYVINSEVECIINCGVFVMELLETYDYKLIDWESWPTVSNETKSQYLEDWLNYNRIPVVERPKYYNINKEIRGKHIVASSFSGNFPSKYDVTEELSNSILNYFAGQ